jgi:polyhydroxyalkanoate synthesis repressor PhaR
MEEVPVITVKKYGNRRLYDTEASEYVTLEELAERIRRGADVRIVDAASGEDLTQATLTQIIVEGRGAAKLLAVPLLTQMIRMEDDALAEFFGRYVTWALEVYLTTRRSAKVLGPLDPFGLVSKNPLLRMLGSNLPMPWQTSPSRVRDLAMLEDEEIASPPAPPPAPPRDGASASEVAELRRELEALKKSVHARRRKR